MIMGGIGPYFYRSPKSAQVNGWEECEMTLDQLALGHRAVVTAVGGEGALRRRLLDMGITPKTTILMRKKAPMGDPVEICLRGYELTLRLEDARKITVEGGTRA